MFANTLRSLSQGDGFIKAMGKKIYDFGNLIVLCDEKNIYGFAGYYANDIILKKAYISMIAIYPQYRGCGYGRDLLNAISNYASLEGMEIIRLQVDKCNAGAIKFYQKCMFRIVEECDDSYYMEYCIERKQEI